MSARPNVAPACTAPGCTADAVASLGCGRVALCTLHLFAALPGPDACTADATTPTPNARPARRGEPGAP